MADAPWRCSQCGTVNEPNANACRSCGRWPSLFDLEQGTLDVEQPPEEVEEAFTRHAPPIEEVEVPVEATPPAATRPPAETGQDDSATPEKHAEWPGPENPLDRMPQGLPGRLATWIVPILIVLYIVVSAIVDR